MSAKASIPGAVLLSMLIIGTAPCQETTVRPDSGTRLETPTAASAFMNGDAPPPSEGATTPGTLSKWIAFPEPGCCCFYGGNGPIKSELFIRTGPSLPVHGGTLAHTLDTGWEIQGGGRSLFFNKCQDKAWFVELGLADIYNNGGHPNLRFDERGQRNMSVQAVNRTFVNLGIGREWYLLHPANYHGFNWRAGLDGGLQYGIGRVDFTDPDRSSGYFRRNGVVSGLYTAVHTDIEIPWNCCTALFGLRCEWSYQWTDILHDHTADLSNVNFLVTSGVRF